MDAQPHIVTIEALESVLRATEAVAARLPETSPNLPIGENGGLPPLNRGSLQQARSEFAEIDDEGRACGES